VAEVLGVDVGWADFPVSLSMDGGLLTFNTPEELHAFECGWHTGVHMRGPGYPEVDDPPDPDDDDKVEGVAVL